jgi:hypothetical protein
MFKKLQNQNMHTIYVLRAVQNFCQSGIQRKNSHLSYKIIFFQLKEHLRENNDTDVARIVDWV